MELLKAERKSRLSRVVHLLLNFHKIFEMKNSSNI